MTQTRTSTTNFAIEQKVGFHRVALNAGRSKAKKAKKLCSRLFSSEVQFQMENGRFVFLSPRPLEGVEATYDDHLRLTGKRVVDFLSVLIELFC